MHFIADIASQVNFFYFTGFFTERKATTALISSSEAYFLTIEARIPVSSSNSIILS